MAPAEAAISAARAWIGTPYAHGAARRGQGCDCLGLIRGLRADLGAPVPPPPPYPAGWALRGGPEALAEGVAALLPPAEAELAPGQVLLFRLRAGAPAGHLGVLVAPPPYARFIHAYDRHGVVESPLAPAWARRIVARFQLI